MDSRNLIEGALGRVGTAVGSGVGVTVADHTTIIQGALVAIAGVVIDLVIRGIRNKLQGQ